MSIAARLRRAMKAATLDAAIDRRASFRRSATLDRRHGLKLFRMHLLSVLVTISWSVGTKDISDRRLLSRYRLRFTSYHLRPPSSRRP
jgi:hypothetical protein